MSTSSHPGWPQLWLPELEAIARGVAHSMSNRAGALGALVELGDAAHPEGQAGIRSELARLYEVNALLKLLVAPPRGEAEALTLAEVCSDAARLHSLRLDLRDVPCAVVADRDVAVRTDRVRLLQLLVVLLARAGTRAPARLAMEVSGTESESRVHLTGVAGAPASHGSHDLHAYARELGALLTEGRDEVVLVLPSLQEIRRRERAGGTVTPPRPPAP